MSTWHNYFTKLHEYLTWQTNKINKLEQQLVRLEKEIQELKQRPQTTIEKIEYKFDQLKVETLEGTLNIGLTPNGGTTIEDFAVSPEKTVIPKPEPVLFRNIQAKINDYLANDCKTLLAELETKYMYPLDDVYRQFILQDIHRQVDERIQFYLQQKMNSGYVPDPSSSEAVETEIIQKVKQDIEQSLDSFMKHLPKQGGKE
ncbi:spore germination protein GerPC [Anoxybacteroides amylolyticum]|uniref:Spore germination GerPC family protein n=1 Tax=Anoxybacteroides amylolyticum TaxID=294699 RepID=A0A160F527_9BACL|nr:spore germination protein GerPC [Anoxybacillus amylolyticus]ANB61587.1 spore germination GerPC family protein [Anoxybacillus amylolyticus]